MKGPFVINQILILLILSGLMASCIPQSAPRTSDLQGSNLTTSGTTGGTTNTEELATFDSETRNFIDRSTTRIFNVLTLPITENDTFIVWGNSVQTQIKSLPLDSKVCLLAEFKDTNPSKILAMSALRRRVILGTKKTATGTVTTVGYQWIVFPNDGQRNQSNCLTTGIINTKNSIYGATTTLKFSLQDVCANCLNSVASEGMKAFFDSGNEVADVNLSALKIKIDITSSTTPTTAQCSSNSACAQIGFNCCLDGQCVRDGAVKNGVDTSSGPFQIAWEDIQNNPTRFTIYPQFFYVCPTTVPTVPGDSDATDPAFAALKRINEMKDIYECLNPQFDEIGYCAIKYPNASIRIKSTNPADKIFNVALDDNNFSWANNLLNQNSIYSFRYAEQLLYQEGLTGFDSTNVPGSHSFPGSGNSNLSSAQSVNISKTLASNALDDTLIIKYKVDATCEKLSSALARCKKTYVQGRSSSTPRPADHLQSNYFALPSYADLVSFVPTVKIGETSVAASDTTWRVSGNGILFTSQVTTNQTVTITYYVTPLTADLDILTTGRSAAQTRVNEICGCGVIGTTNCNLTPVTETNAGVTKVTDYNCVYPPPPIPEPPLQQVVYVSGKSIPSRYFDINGAVWDNDEGASAPAQEGLPFLYTNGDALKPNNLTSYVGFHEIYGSFDKQGGSAKPPRKVNVKKDRIYDIFVDNGGFASCDNCGNDPYNPILKLFPQNFASRAGGYVPDLYNSSRTANTGLYRAEDLLFGRACFVPASMIAWGHAADTDVNRQRQRRLAAQHFLFANGYQRDWYGFDYGSLIGSFDGVTWFSIGNQRRIKASGSKLLLAVNTYFGDKTVDNNFKVIVSEALSAINSGSSVTTDIASDGAQCQKSHFCNNDNDCIASLGYDYTCQNVAPLTASRPIFDTSANETAGSEVRSIAAIIGGLNGQAKRCVYRGRGAPCTPDLNSLTNTFNGTNTVAFSACAPNYYCAKVDGTARFNTSIARFASSPLAQNLLGTLGTKDTIGLGARSIGRPLDFYGTKTPATITNSAWGFTSTDTLREHLKTSANIPGVCIPGRDVSGSSTFADAQQRVPALNDKEAADRILGIGSAGKVSSSVTTNPKLTSMCPTTISGTFIHHDPAGSLTDATLVNASAKQNISSSLLDMSEYSSLPLFNTDSTGKAATSIGLQKNACLRAAGASCFSDMECAPSEFISLKMKTLASWGSFANNLAEQAFWKEELICGNPEPVKLFSNSFNAQFNEKNNRCCRATSKTMQIYTQFDTNTNFVNCVGGSPAVAGLNLAVNSTQRNPRNNIISDVANCNPSGGGSGSSPALMAPSPKLASDTPMDIQKILKQYETLDTMNSRMCCTGNWVRSFATENGGGHQWGPSRIQNIDKSIFAAWNWYYDRKFTNVLDESEDMACSADNFGTLACEIRTLTDAQQKLYLEWIDRFELVGIPQVLIKIPTSANGLERNVVGSGSDQSSLELQGRPLLKTLNEPMVRDIQDGSDGYISATSYSKMDVNPGKLKKVFSESEFNCCLPAGANIPQNATAQMCCTGTLTNQSADGAPSEARCCLDDFADVSVYLNRYVSSEGRGLPESMYDKKTGYISDPGQVYAIAQNKNLCCSGNIVTGTVIADLFVPLQGGNRLPQAKTKRFAYRSDAIDNNDETGAIGNIYDAGLRWNNHFYCAPADYTPPGQQSN
ncbi:MAG: hypothetical protein K2P81_09505 [Bacteriovoracaceae bacterium]|nr:hypothetical protein [Bacteriovoracaceae bacterium]